MGLAAGLSFYSLFRIRLNMDVGWMLYLAERIGFGERLYVDRVEVNLPWIVYLSRIPVGLGSILNTPSYTVFRWLLIAGAAASVVVTTTWMPARHSRGPLRPLTIAATLLLLFLWIAGSDIGQREHLLVLALVPYLALRWRAEPPSVVTALVVGTIAGTAIALKPHFVILWVVIEVDRRVQGIPWRRPEAMSAASVLAISWILLPTIHSAYFGVLQEYGWLYSRFRPFPVAGMLRVETVTLIAMVAAWLLSRRAGRGRSAIRELLIVAGASLIIAFVQGKGFTYHLLPAHVFAALGLLVSFSAWKPGPIRWRSIPIQLLLGLSLGLYTAWAGSVHRWSENRSQQEYRPAVELVELSDSRARSIMVLSPHMLDAFPLVNLLGLEWTSRYNSLWPILSLYAGVEPVRGSIPFRCISEMEHREAKFFNHIAVDFIEHEPDLILVAMDEDPLLGGRFDFLGYLSQDSSVAKALTAYELVARQGRLRLYERSRGLSQAEGR